MRKIYFLFIMLALFAAGETNAQISVTGGSGLAATYSSFTKAGGLFEAINLTAQTGNNILVTITANINNEDGAISLNAGAWSTISIKPSGGTARTISGAVTAGLPMINFNGADNVTIDGLNTGGNSLTISNTTVSATAGTSTIKFFGDANNNTITNCSILGSSTTAAASNGGNIWFSAGAVTTGNDGNTISNCNIGAAGANLASKGIYFSGTTTTVALNNSGNSITGNNFIDIFNGGVASAGIYSGNGATANTITNNKFYQTGTRTFATGTFLHCAIQVNNTASAAGFTITGNTIGYASSTQTGTYTLAGATFAGKFNAIVFSGLTGGASSSISNNTIASVSLTGVTSSGTAASSPFAAILVTSGVVTTSNNSIGSQTATGSLVYNTTTTTSTDIYGIYNAGSDALTVSNNQIGGLTITNAGASGTFIVYGIRGSASSAVSWTVTSNIVGGTIASSIQCSSSSTLAQLIGIYNSAPAGVLTSNTIRNLTINGGTGTTTSASLIGISSAASSANQTISQNTIHNLSNSNTTLATTVTGIQFTGSTSNTVERNKIYALTNASSSATAIINGINISGGTTTYQNNMIALGAGMSNSPVISGISEPLGTDNFIHNSIYIGGTATSGSAASYAFNSTQTVVARIIRDNIFVNNRGNSGATAKHYIIRVGGTTPLPVTGLTSNNNIYFANGAGAVFGNFNAADVATLAAWKTAVGQDANSYQSDPQYLGATAATPDLHINAAISTVAESNGADVGVTNDFDGQTRSGFTPVDIGADAGNFTGVDLTGPIITYTPLNNTCTLTGVTLTATITDVSGVPTSGAGLPKLYWKVNSGSYTALTAAFVSGNTYSFTFGAGSVGNTISYYIVAQDAAATPNVSCSPAAGAAGFTAGPPAVSTTPTTPSAFNLQNSLSGTYNVGVGKTYTTISAAIAAYNTSCLSGPVVFSLSDAAYTEAAAMTINANSFASAVNTLTIKPTQANTTIAVTGGSASAIFILNGADYVTIDGSTGSTANTVCPLSAASRNLTITNSNAGTTSAVVWLQTNGADAATNNIIRNCNLVGNSNTTTLFAVGAGSSTISTSSLGAGNNNNAYVNNNISKTQYGIYSQGTSAASKNTGTVINQNFINTVSPNNVGVGGILAGFESSITISGNTISEINGTSDRFGISAGFGTSFSGSTLVAAEVTNASITNNIIGNIIGTGTNSSLGIALGAAASGTSLIANNMVYGITHNSTTTDIAAGIAIGGGAGSVTNIYHNTVSMQGAITGVTAANSTSACLAVTATSAPVLDIRNNIFSNTQSNNSGAGMRFTAIALGYTSATGNYSGLTSNNNDLYAAGSLGTYTAGITGGITGTNRVSLANWNTETGRDAAPASKNVLPVFLSSTNLHLDNTNSSNASNLDGSAATGTGVTADIDCATRNGSTPDMGADEITTPNCTGATGGTASGSIAFCGSGTPTISATGYSTGTTTTYQWYASTVLADYPNAGAAVSGQANPAALTTGIVSATTYYWLRVTCVAASAIGNSTMVTVTVNPIPALTTVSGAGTFCTSTTITAANGADGTMYFQGIISGGTNISFPSASQTITTSNTYYFRAQSAAGCWGPEGSTTVVIETSPVITPGNATLCQNGTGSMTATSTCFSAGSIEWYTAAAGGSSIGAGSPFNPVGVAGSGLTNTATAGTTVYYAACSNVPVCRVAVNFLIKSNYNIVASAGSGGIISSSGNTKLSCDGTASKTYTITPNACYSVADVLVDGVSQGAISSYTFSNVSANHTIAASFVLKTYVITATAGANGTVTPATGPVNCGSNATYTITASPGYSISNVDVDAVSQGAISSYTFSNVQAVHTISATFVINCVNAGITSATAAPAGPLCSGQTTTLSANGVVGTNALVTWYTGTGATGANLGTGTSLPNRGPGTYYAYVTGNCGTPAEASITISSTGNTFSGSGNWTDNARWSCGTAPSINDVITIASGAIVTLNTNFTVAGNLSMAATSKLIVSPTSSLTVSGSADFAGQPVIFKSDNTGTASLGQVTGTLTGATNVTVERYIPQNANKAWRLLASNTVGQTIKQAWQENQTGYNSNANPGFGTMIPGSGGSLAAVQANGFDTLSLGKSLFKYNPLTDNMDPVANTNNTQLSSETGYFIFIRGNRSPNQFGSGAAQSSTVLRSTGSIYIGNQPAVNVPAGQYALIRNPYPSRLDMRQIARTGGLVDAYQVWDPKLAGAFAVGAYQTFTKNSSTGDYEVSPGGGSYGANGSVYNYIESGAAFFAQATGSSGTVQVLESSKASGSQVVFRPSSPLSVSSRLLFNVYANNVGSTDVVDGGFVDFDDAYSNAVDASDVRKSTNFGENFGILRNNTELVVERRKSVSANDTIFFKMYQLRQMSYRIDLETTGFDPLLTTAVLQDKFTGTNTTIDLSGPAASYTFTVNGTAGSFATDRFRLVLAASANVFSGTGNWTDNARWSHGAPPASGEVVTIAADANATLNSNFTVGGSLTMNATSTLTVDPARTLAVGTGGTVNFNGQSVTFKSDITGTASLGQMLGTLNGATNVTVERYIPNNGFRSWRLLSVPTFSSGQTIRQAWQEGVANPLPLQNNLAGYGTQITGAGINAAASQAAGFDNAGTTSSLLSWNGTGWTGAASTNTAIAAQKAWFLYVRGERSKGVSGAVTDASATTLRTNGTLYTGNQSTAVPSGSFTLVGNVYPSAIDFTGLIRNNVNNLFYIWDSKKQVGSSLGVYQTFSGTNGFIPTISGGSYSILVANTTIESGQGFFVTGGTTPGGGSITLTEAAKISGTNGNLGFRPSATPAKINSRLYNAANDMLDANVVVFDAAYNSSVDENDAVKLGNPGANFAIETDSKLLAIEGRQPATSNDVVQFRIWNLKPQNYRMEFAGSNIITKGLTAVLEDQYLNSSTVINLDNTTRVNFTIDNNAASAAANRFRITFRKARVAVEVKQGYVIAPNPVNNGSMNLQFMNQAAGKYAVHIMSTAGQSVMLHTINHAGGNSNQLLELPATMARGTYQVEIIAPDNTRTVQQLFVNRK